MRYAHPRIFCFVAAARDAVYARAPTLLLPQPPPLGPLAAYSFLGLPHVRRTTFDARPPTATALLLLLSLVSPVGTLLIGTAASSCSTRTRDRSSTRTRLPGRPIAGARSPSMAPLHAEAVGRAARASVCVSMPSRVYSLCTVCVTAWHSAHRAAPGGRRFCVLYS